MVHIALHKTIEEYSTLAKHDNTECTATSSQRYAVPRIEYSRLYNTESQCIATSSHDHEVQYNTDT